MQILRHYLNPKHIEISVQQIAQLLGINPQRILNWQLWHNVLWVHIQGKGGYFVSYRRLKQWLLACKALIYYCPNQICLQRLWKCIEQESQRYTPEAFAYLTAMVRKREKAFSGC